MIARTAIVVGAGVGGLTAAISLAARGVRVTVLERASAVGGKLKDVSVAGQRIDTGPTVLTKREIFQAIFADAGESFERHVPLTRLDVLARHFWSDGSSLDLHSDERRSTEAIAAFAGGAAVDGYRRFCAEAKRTFETLDAPFMQIQRPSLPGMLARIALRSPRGFADMWALQPYASLWRELGRYFPDPRLRQLFARYTTYCGGSPFQAPATLMLVAHLEQQGVWAVDGGMQRIAVALETLAKSTGVDIHTSSHVAEIVTSSGSAIGVRLADGGTLKADAIVFNGDVAALAAGELGPGVRRALPHSATAPRSLSAITASLVADVSGPSLAHHNVVFADDYRDEFDAIFKRSTITKRPTVYVCAPDSTHIAASSQRLFCLINAPATGDAPAQDMQESEPWLTRILEQLQRCGLSVKPRTHVHISTPSDFHHRFPATGGALYGPAPHAVMSAFRRAGSRTRVTGLYLAGGSIHPGPGLPMAAQSGRLAAQCLLADLASSRTWHPVVTRGGTSTASATTKRTP
jgi:1-hydroxycarotenoid 3,4-desaturase